jgi:beta-N-acetylhexosaminidase
VLGPVVVDIAGKELAPAERERLLHPLVGMVILFSRNYASPEQLRALTEEIHALRSPPLLITVDHEGGRVQRFRTPPFTHLPAMAALGKLWDRDVLTACRTAVSAGFVLASELRAFGVDFSFTPVVDVNWGRSAVIGDRAFHADTRVIAMLAEHLCHGLAMAGMSNCGKHFPGHGWAFEDSHFALPADDRAASDLMADAAQYRWLALSLASVMTAHITYPAVDRPPAGFSKTWVDVLRRDFGYVGAIFTDDLSMVGARAVGSARAGAQVAIDAGCDFVLVCNDPNAADDVLAHLAWSRTPIFEERLDRLLPRGPALDIDALQATAAYQQARADIDAWRAQIG